MKYDCLVRGGSVVTAERGVCDADLAIQDGRVAAMLARGSAATADQVVDAIGLFVLPGLIDPHAHVELGPGERRYEETRSAAVGGVTTVMTYVATAEPFADRYDEEKRLVERDAVTDVLIHLGLSSGKHLAHIKEYVEELGLKSFKHFMHFKGVEGSYMGAEGTDDGHLHELLRQVAKYPEVTLNVHAENIEIVWRISEQQKKSGRTDLAAWTDTRPDYVEAEKIASVMVLAAVTGARVYFVHVSNALSLEVYRRLRDLAPGQIFLETCPHYLTHTQFSDIGVVGKVNPPLRSQRDIEALWGAVADGTIHTLGTDHVARDASHKQGDIWASSAGFPGMATMLPVLLSEGFHRRGLPLERIVEVTSQRAAQIFGLYPQKGSLEPGADADFTVVDLERESVVSPEKLYSHAQYSIYEGWSLKGWPVQTFVRGQEVMRDGEIVAASGIGRLLNDEARAGGDI